MRSAVVVAVAACGRVGFEPISASSGGDCWTAWRDGTIDLAPPTAIAELAFTNDQGNPALTADDTTLYFNRSADIYRATRAGRGSPWQTPTIVAELSIATTIEKKLTISTDGRFVVFASDRSGQLQLWAASRSTETGAFGNLTQQPVAAVNAASPGGAFDPQLTADGAHLYSAPATGGTQRIAVSAHTSDMYAAPVFPPELAVGGSTADPVVSPDELVILFSVGPTGGVNDLYYATRAAVSDPFGAAHPIDAITTNADEGDVEISRDGCELLFVSDRAGPKALYTTTAR